MGSLDSILNFVIPALLVVIAVGFVYVKFIGPWILPQLKKFWIWLQESSQQQDTTKKEISYE